MAAAPDRPRLAQLGRETLALSHARHLSDPGTVVRAPSSPSIPDDDIGPGSRSAAVSSGLESMNDSVPAERGKPSSRPIWWRPVQPSGRDRVFPDLCTVQLLSSTLIFVPVNSASELKSSARARSAARAGGEPPDPELVEAVLAASRVVVAVATRALAGVEPEVTLPQFRTLVLLDQQGSISVRELAEALDSAPSTTTRMCDRLVVKGLLARGPHPDDRRQVLLSVTASGRALVARSTARRRAEFERLLSALPRRRQAEITRALVAFTTAAQA